MGDSQCGERPDRLLVSMAQTGLNGAFDELVGKYHQRLRSFLLRRLAHPDEIEDACQEAWYRVYRDLDQYRRARGSFVNWIRGYAENVAHEFNRERQKWHEQAEDELEASALELVRLTGGNNSADPWLAVQAADAIRGMAELPLPLRVPVLAHVLDDAGPTELSNVFGVTVAAAKQKLYRARREAQRLAEQYSTANEAIKPLLGEGMFEIAQRYMRYRDWDTATQWYLRATALDKRAIAWIKDVSIMTSNPDVEREGLRCVMEQVVAQHPSDPWVLLEYANMVRGAVSFEAAQPVYRQALELDPTYDHAAVVYAASLIACEDAEEAYRIIAPYGRKKQRDREVDMCVAQSLAMLGHSGEARAPLLRAISTFTSVPPEKLLPNAYPGRSRYYAATRHKTFGQISERMGELEKARRHYNTAIGLLQPMADRGEINDAEIAKALWGLERCAVQQRTGNPVPLEIWEY